MADENNNTSGKVQFIERHQPALTDGDYTITVEQTVVINAETKLPVQNAKPAKVQQNFSVLGPRFTLDPQEIQAVFPPPGSLGEHSNVLPHIILNRSTLPWERSANGQEGVPWLALLLFDEGDIPNNTGDTAEIKAKNKANQALLDQIKTPNSWKLNEVQTATTVDLPKSSETPEAKTRYPVHFPKLGSSVGDDPEKDVVAVIDVPKGLLSQILPSTDELKLLAHVRQTADTAGNAQGDEVAVIICNRLPKSGSMSIVHLVSLEGNYDDNFMKNVGENDLIRLVSLYSWRFACVSEKQTFKNYLLQLNHPILFNISATDNSGALTGMNIPAKMVNAFELCGHPLGTAPEVKDCGQWKITAGNTYYIIGQNLAVYDFAGRSLFTLDNAKKPSTPVNQETDVANVKDGFSQKGYKLDKNIGIKAVCDHWWIEADESNQRYVVSQEGDTLYIHHLDLDSSSTLRLPRLMTWDEKQKKFLVNESAEKYLAMGCIPLPHEMRQGNQSVSWYHGPLIPGAGTNDISLPIRSADELIRYSPTIGMFDVSYSAAWELGRLLTLQNKRASLDLFNWKRSHAQSLKDAQGQLDHLPFETQTVPDLPDSVLAWFQDLALLKGLPFNYLVADERMLPTESIRFFQVDTSWVECLLDGAFSIGRVLSTDHGRDEDLRKTDLSEHVAGERKLSGFLLRSDVVSGWPGLLVDGYSDSAAKNPALTLMRMDRLSKNVLLCLFDGIVQAIDIHLKPETLHFGVSEKDEEHPVDWYKTPRDPKNGDEQPSQWKEVVLRGNSVIDIAALAQKIAAKQTSADFALQMIEGVEKVRFIQKV